MRKEIFEKMAKLPVGWFDRSQTGDILSRISYDVDTINTSLSSDIVQIFSSTVTIVGSLAMMISISPKLSIIFVFTFPLSVVLIRMITSRTKPLFRARSKKLGELNAMSEELITGQKTLKAYRQEENTIARFDVMNKVFPLEYTERKGIVFDVQRVSEREIEISDVCLDRVERDMFVAFYTGYIEREPYGSRTYFAEHPQLSHALIDALLEKHVSMIGVDFAGIRRGKEHTPKDQYCADRGVFVIENLCNLKELLKQGDTFTACTYPMHWQGVTGIPCRVIAKI
jgi:ABC-type multidrug transport system fused ATPase/permease subunit